MTPEWAEICYSVKGEVRQGKCFKFNNARTIHITTTNPRGQWIAIIYTQ